MSDTKQHFYKTLNAIVGTHRIDNEEAYIINDYISRLEATIKDEQEEINKQKEILDKIKDWKKQTLFDLNRQYKTFEYWEELFEDLDKLLEEI